MIRINLLGAGSVQAVRPVSAGASSPPRVTAAAIAILLVTAVGLGSWFWMLRQQSAAVDADTRRAAASVQELQAVLARIKSFEARTAQLQQRVSLIEQLQAGQSAAARVLDQISRSVPEHLWLNDLTQGGSDFTIGGFAGSMTALTDFVTAVESTRWFRKPVEIIDSQVASDADTGDLVRFVIKASYVDPNAVVPPAKAVVVATR